MWRVILRREPFTADSPMEVHYMLGCALVFHFTWSPEESPNIQMSGQTSEEEQLSGKVLSALCIRLGHQGWSFLISTHFPSGFWNGTVA